MTLGRRRTAVAAAVLLSLLGTAGPAPAAPLDEPRLRIAGITPVDGRVDLVVEATGLPEGVTLDPSSVRVTVGDQEVDAEVAGAGAEGAVSRTAVLVIDTSGSMRGAGIQGAQGAALAFLSEVPDEVAVGLVAFSESPEVLVPPTTERAAVRTAVEQLVARGETALYDAVGVGLDVVGTTGVRSVIVLSDGGDTASTTGLEPLVQRLSQAEGVTVDAVAFQTDEAQGDVLTGLTAATAGRVTTAADVAALGEAFRAAARTISGQLLVSAQVPEDVSGSARVGVTARAGDARLADSVVALLPVTEQEPTQDFGARPVERTVSPFESRPVLLAALAAVFLGLTLLLGTAAAAFAGDGDRGRVRRRLASYSLTPRRRAPVEESALGSSAVARGAVGVADRIVTARGLEAGLLTRLEAAGIPLRPAEWLIVHGLVALGVALVLLLMAGGRLPAALFGLAIGAVAPFLYLSVKRDRREADFLEMLPDTLQLMAGSLSAGYSLPQAIDAVVRESKGTVTEEFNRALVESRLGVPVEDALESIADRMESRDFAWVVMAIRMQRDVGGNLAEVLTTVANTLREREMLRRQVRVLSAEGRLSAIILFALPILLALYLVVSNYAYISILWTDPRGLVIFAFLVINMTLGGLWLRKLVNMEV